MTEAGWWVLDVMSVSTRDSGPRPSDGGCVGSVYVRQARLSAGLDSGR